jgi:hypothetical protein
VSVSGRRGQEGEEDETYVRDPDRLSLGRTILVQNQDRISHLVARTGRRLWRRMVNRRIDVERVEALLVFTARKKDH